MRPARVSLGSSQLLVDLRPNEEHALKWAPLEVATSAVQAAKDYSQHEVRGRNAAAPAAAPVSCCGAPGAERVAASTLTRRWPRWRWCA